MTIYSSIPTELCIYSLTKSKVNHLKLFVYLKHVTNGRIASDSSQYKTWASDLNISSQTIRTVVKWMITQKWITVNGKKNELRITSYYRVCKKLGFKCNLAAKFEGDDFNHLGAFCAGVAMTYFLKRKNWMEKKRRPVSKMGDTLSSRNRNPKGFSTLPIRYFAKCLGVSISTANNYKLCAKKIGLITVKRQINNLVGKDDKPIMKEALIIFALMEESSRGRFRSGSKFLKVVDCDLIRSNVLCTRKRFKHGKKL